MQQEVEFLRFLSSFKYLKWHNNKNLTIIITFVSLCCCIPAWRSWYRSWWTWDVSSSWWEDWSSCRTSILISPFFDLPPPSWWVEYCHSEMDKAECRSPFSALHSDNRWLLSTNTLHFFRNFNRAHTSWLILVSRRKSWSKKIGLTYSCL